MCQARSVSHPYKWFVYWPQTRTSACRTRRAISAATTRRARSAAAARRATRWRPTAPLARLSTVRLINATPTWPCCIACRCECSRQVVCAEPADEPLSLVVVTERGIQRVWPHAPSTAPSAYTAPAPHNRSYELEALNVRAIDYHYTNRCLHTLIFYIHAIGYRVRAERGENVANANNNCTLRTN